MKFEDTVVCREHRYSLGLETTTGTAYIAIPVSNRMVDYLEYYRLGDDEYAALGDDAALALDFADSCRRRERDERLFMPPGTDRGVPR